MHSFDGIKRFNWSDLNGKSLTIHVVSDVSVEDGKSTVVIGKDEDTGVYYILHHEHQKISPFKVDGEPVYRPSYASASSSNREHLERHLKKLYASPPLFTSHIGLTDEELEECLKKWDGAAPEPVDDGFYALWYSLLPESKE